MAPPTARLRLPAKSTAPRRIAFRTRSVSHRPGTRMGSCLSCVTPRLPRRSRMPGRRSRVYSAPTRHGHGLWTRWVSVRASIPVALGMRNAGRTTSASWWVASALPALVLGHGPVRVRATRNVCCRRRLRCGRALPRTAELMCDSPRAVPSQLGTAIAPTHRGMPRCANGVRGGGCP
jgi:hypothetical protein